jgi:mannosyltransferase
VADRLAGTDRVWVVGDKRVLRRESFPKDAVERAELAALKGRFTPRWQYVSGRVALRLYVRRAPGTGSSPLGRP